MQDLKLLNSKITMLSLEIATLTGKRHDHVMRDIRKMLEDLGQPKNGEREYIDSRGKTQPMYELNEELTITLVSGYSTVLRNKIIKRWKELEQEKSYNIIKLPANYEEALEELLVKVKENKILEKRVEFLEPFKTKVDGSKLIFPRKESVYDQERGFKKDLKELCPFLSNDKITNILEFYTTQKYKNTDYYVKDEIEYSAQKFIEECTTEIKGAKKTLTLHHKCLPGGKTIVNKDFAIQYLGKCEEDFE